MGVFGKWGSLWLVRWLGRALEVFLAFWDVISLGMLGNKVTAHLRLLL